MRLADDLPLDTRPDELFPQRDRPQMGHALDNPVWSALNSAHARFAQRAGQVARYPAQVAPFVATGSFDAENAGADLAAIADVGETMLFVGTALPLPCGWQVDQAVHIAQMICEQEPIHIDGPPLVELGGQHAADVLNLTARVYPHYFRPRTTELGRYFGIYDGTKLAAMAGERMRFDGHTELSAICTDPAYLGRGYAQRLVAMLSFDILDAGRLPFLHVSHENERAKRLYEHMGFRFRANIPLTAVTRLA